MDALHEKVVINQDNRVFMAKDLIKSSKLVMYYFSATWCSKWLYFVPKMKKVYEEGKKRKSGLEVIFVSLDNDNPTMMKHFKAQGNWYALVFGDDTIREMIYRYNITYLPCAIVVTPEGIIVTKNGISEVEDLGINVLVTWSY